MGTRPLRNSVMESDRASRRPTGSIWAWSDLQWIPRPDDRLRGSRKRHCCGRYLGDGARLVLAGGYALDLAVQPPEGGAVTRIPDQDCYTPGQVVALAATPATGYLFAGWAGDAGGDTNPLLLTMDGHKAVLARFE